MSAEETGFASHSDIEMHYVGVGIARPFFVVFSEVIGRADAKVVSVHYRCACKKTTPQPTSSAAPLTQGSFLAAH